MNAVSAGVLVFLISQLALIDITTCSVQLVSESNNALASKLYNVLAKRDKKNIFISPLSIDYALAALAIGTDGPAFNELATALNFPNNVNNLKTAYKDFTNTLKNDKNITIATKFFVDNGFKIKEGYKRELVQYFESTLGDVDFNRNAEVSRKQINQWVEDKTNKRIKDMLAQGSVDSNTVAVLINAIHFKSEWAFPFESKNTKKEKFYGLDREFEVDMMHITRDFSTKYDDNLKANLVKLPYKGDYSMLLLVPTERYGIIELEKKLSAARANSNSSSSFLDPFLLHMYPGEVVLSFPKFQLEVTTELTDVLKEIGINSIFTGGGLTKIADDPRLIVSDVLQKAFINIDETSTEAAAATALEIVPYAFIVPVSRTVTVDHPFIFFIVHELSNLTVFMGRYTNNI